MESALLEQWPQSDEGGPEAAALLRVEADFPAYIAICCSMLESFAIPYYTTRPGVGHYTKIGIGISTEGVEVYVPASRLEEARQLLSSGGGAAGEYNEEETI